MREQSRHPARRRESPPATSARRNLVSGIRPCDARRVATRDETRQTSWLISVSRRKALRTTRICLVLILWPSTPLCAQPRHQDILAVSSFLQAHVQAKPKLPLFVGGEGLLLPARVDCTPGAGKLRFINRKHSRRPTSP